MKTKIAFVLLIALCTINNAIGQEFKSAVAEPVKVESTETKTKEEKDKETKQKRAAGQKKSTSAETISPEAETTKPTASKTTNKPTPAVMKNTIYDFVVKDITGKDFKLSSLRGKKVMIVNTASECGLTPQYKELEELYNMFKGENFVIIGFPANNFGGQEPGSDKEIAAFCQKNYGVTFPMMSKISVAGDDMAPLYHFLTEKAKNGLEDSKVEWNFQKYLINEKGELIKVILPKTSPLDESVVLWFKNGY